MRRFLVLLSKEVRELATPQILVPFVITIAVFVLIGNVVGEQSGQRQSARVKIIENRTPDPSGRLPRTASGPLAAALREAGFSVSVMSLGPPHATPGSPEWKAVESSGTYADWQTIGGNAWDASIVLALPRGFGSGIAEGRQETIRAYTVTRDFSFFATRDAGALKAVIEAVNGALSDQAIEAAAPRRDPEALKRPIRLEEHVIVGGRTARVSAEEVVGFISSQTTFIPIVVFIVIVFAAQMIATAVASEKENKTLETLLSTPVRRWALVTAKMVAAALIALLSASAYLFGMRYYMNGLTEGLGTAAQGPQAVGAPADVMRELGLTLGAPEYALLGLTLFAGILVALAIALILGAFAENVKAVQSLLTPLMVLVMIPYFLTLFLDIRTASPLVRAIVYAIPFSYPFTAAPNLFLGQYGRVWFGIAYEFVWFLAFALIAARVFSSDRILTMKLNLGRRR